MSDFASQGGNNAIPVALGLAVGIAFVVLLNI
jgi:hypothetical protein